MGYAVMCWPAIVLHELLDASQKSPVVAPSQSAVPHAQSVGFAAVPSVLGQAARVLHRLFEASQKSPVVVVQAPEVPQMQGAGLAIAPSPWDLRRTQPGAMQSPKHPT